MKFKRGQWVSDEHVTRLAKIKHVHLDMGGVLLDLVMYDREGRKLGRVSPVLGGPRTFEPCCDPEGLFPIVEPTFPLNLVWIKTGPDTQRAGYHVERLTEEAT